MSLLNLDCSSDLKSYHGDPGPGRKANCLDKTSDTIGGQMDNQGVDLLSQGLYYTRGNPACVLEVTAQNGNQQTASNGRPEETHPPDLPEELSDDDMSEFSPEPRKALEESAKFYEEDFDSEMCYEVHMHCANQYMDDSWEIIGTWQTLKEANKELVLFAIDEGYYDPDQGMKYKVEEGGSLKLYLDIEEGYATMHIEEVPVRRTFGRKI